MRQYVAVGGVLIEPMGHLWAAYSPATQETALLNDETVSILELLEPGAASTRLVATGLATDSGIDVDTLSEIVENAWPRLIEAGLVREQCAGLATAR